MKTQKKETTEYTEKNICRTCLMQFHLCELCGFKKGNYGERREKYLQNLSDAIPPM